MTARLNENGPERAARTWSCDSWIAVRTTSSPQQAPTRPCVEPTDCVNKSVMGDPWEKKPEDWVEEKRIVDAEAKKPEVQNDVMDDRRNTEKKPEGAEIESVEQLSSSGRFVLNKFELLLTGRLRTEIIDGEDCLDVESAEKLKEFRGDRSALSASHPGPRLSQRSRRIVQSVSSSDEEPLLASHRNVIPRVTGATSVTGATQLDVEAMEPCSVPETILDALEEDLVRRNRRLVLVDGSRRQGSTTETDFTRWDSDAQFSMPSRPSEFQSQIVDVTVMDSDSSPVVTPRPLAVEGTQPAQVDSLSANRFAPLEDDDPRIEDSSNESETLSVVNPEFVDRVQEVPLFPRDDSVAQVRHPQGAMIEDITVSPAIRTALRSLDEVDVQHLFRDRAVVMKHCEMFGVRDVDVERKPNRRNDSTSF